MKDAGVQIVEPIAMRPADDPKSFFVEGPDNVLIEIVKAKPIPDVAESDEEQSDDQPMTRHQRCRSRFGC